ncbi:trypsin-like peptidase domain-containing protein [bacterium]|nr:trypsin-like peptidase domain-containing protein [bacterium]
MGLYRLGEQAQYERMLEALQTDSTRIMPPALQTPPDSTPTLEADAQQEIEHQRHNAITSAIQKAAPAVVGISVTQLRQVRSRNPYAEDPFFRYFFGIPDRTIKRKVENLGSGFIMSADGYVVTNEHVVHEAEEIMVTMTNGRSFEAEVVGTDYDTDLALLKIEAKDLPYLSFSDDDELIVGEWVIAIGNPFGLFKVNDQPSVSVGVISAMGRDFERQDDGRLYSRMIQTDAAINPGNSGGPLVNVHGQVIGVNTFIFTGGGSGSVGVGFALPADILRDVVEQLRTRGGIERDFWTGLAVQNLNRLVAMSLGYSGNGGVIITEVDEESPGKRAGFLPTDIIVEVGGTPIINTQTIRNYFDNHDLRVGDTLNFMVFRDRKFVELTLTLEARPK